MQEIAKLYAQWSANTCANPQSLIDIMLGEPVRNSFHHLEPIIDALGNVLFVCF